MLVAIGLANSHLHVMFCLTENNNSIREKVEQGEKVHNSLLGKNNFLHVDRNKDICVRGVFIGGLTSDDKLESKVRHTEETISNKLTVESWNSLLRKL